MLKDFAVPKKFSYPAKDITLVAIADLISGRLPRERRNQIMAQATDLVGIVPFDWEKPGNIFIMYFGVDTVELARAAKRRLEESNFKADFWTQEEVLVVAAKLLRRLEGEGVEAGPVTRGVKSLEGRWEAEIIDWRNIDQQDKYQN